MKKLFISHSSKDRKLVEEFIEFLQLGMGVKKADIFCTAYPEILATGRGFVEEIHKQMQECEMVLFIITEEYLQSAFCLAEMGAAWGMGKQCFPLLTVDYRRLDGTPLLGIQMRKLSSIDDMSVLYDELHKCGILDEYQTAEFNRRLSKFVESVKTSAQVLSR